MGWGDVLKNSLKDAEGIVDPRSYVPLSKAVVEFGIGNPRPALRLAEGMAKSYKSLAEHPIREFQKHPVGTVLSVLPVAGGLGKLADVGAAGVASEATLWKSLKYDPGDGMQSHFAGSVPGAKVNRDLLHQLQTKLGHPNVLHYVDHPDPKTPGAKGMFKFNGQQAVTYLHPGHLHVGDEARASADLTDTMLHEARHGYQAANWSRTKRFIDTHRRYENQWQEKDANAFARENSAAFKGLVKTDPRDPRISNDRLPPERRNELPSDPEQLSKVIDAFHAGEPGIDPMKILEQIQAEVHAGRMHPDDAMDLEMALDGAYKKGVYKPPVSQEQLLARGIAQARRKTPTFNGNKAAAIRNSFNEPTDWGQAR